MTLAMGLLASSTAWACTSITGTTSYNSAGSPTSGKPGTVISVGGTNLSSGGKYIMEAAGDYCMTGDPMLAGPYTPGAPNNTILPHSAATQIGTYDGVDYSVNDYVYQICMSDGNDTGTPISFEVFI